MSDPVPVTAPVEVRWSDLDAVGHVNNAVYLTYFEQARLGYFRALMREEFEVDPSTSLPVGYSFIIAEATCSYRSPVTIQDRPVVAIHVSQVGRKSFVFEYRMTEEVSGRLLAEGCSTQVWYDYGARRSVVVPSEAVRQMERLQGAAISTT